MKQVLIYPSRTDRFSVRYGGGKTKTLLRIYEFGNFADKPAMLELYEQ